MKQILSLLLAFPLFIQAATEKELKSEIKHVTVFFKGAQVHRSSDINLTRGSYEIVFSGLENNIDNNSIQIRGNGDYLIKSYFTRRNYLQKVDLSDEIRDLEDQYRELKMDLEELALDRTVLKDEESLILKNQNLAGQQSGMDIEQLKQTSLFYQSRLKEIRTAVLKIDRMTKEKQKKQQQILNQINQMRSIKHESVNQLVVNLEVEKTTKGKMEISYYVPDASWVPFYEVMVDEINKPIQLVYKARVNQNTGIMWKDVQLTLSTTQPNLSGQVPTLSPWYLSFNSPQRNRTAGITHDKSTYRGSRMGSGASGKIYGTIRDGETGESLPYATVVGLDANGNTVNGTTTDLNGYFAFNVSQNIYSIRIDYIGYQSAVLPINGNLTDGFLYSSAEELSEVVVSAYADGAKMEKEYNATPTVTQVYQPSNLAKKATFFEYQIKSPYTIPSDNLHETVHIRDVEISAKYEYQTVPKLDKDVFLVARIYGWEEYNLLNGDARLYFEKTFVGKSFLNIEFMEDTLGLSLGRDKNIIVARDKVFDQSGQKSFSGNKKETRQFTIQVRNNKDEDIHLRVSDQYPLSNQKKITVKLEESGEAKVEEKTGFLTWKINLGSSDNRKMEFRYSVSYPEEYYVTIPE